MSYYRHQLHLPTQQRTQDIFAQLRAFRGQLATLNLELADMERRITVLKQHQQVFQNQLDIWHRERDYFIALKVAEEHKQ